MLLAGVGLMLFAPFSSWRFRLNALAMEFVLPATRGCFLRETLIAMALDFCTWTATVTAVVLCGGLAVRGQDGFDYPILLFAHVAGLWGLAVLLFGIGLATLRFRAWMPLFIAGLLGSVFSASLVATFAAGWYERYPSQPYVIVGTFAAACAMIGLGLAWATYRHWLKMDLK